MNGGVLYTGLVCPDASYVHLPLIAIVHPLPADWQRLVEAVATVGDADILLFTSRNAVFGGRRPCRPQEAHGQTRVSWL